MSDIIDTVAEPEEDEAPEFEEQMCLYELDEFTGFELVPYALTAIVDGIEELTPTTEGEADESFTHYGVVGRLEDGSTEVIADIYQRTAGELLVMALNTYITAPAKAK